jgi:hypothetical protein
MAAKSLKTQKNRFFNQVLTKHNINKCNESNRWAQYMKELGEAKIRL